MRERLIRTRKWMRIGIVILVLTVSAAVFRRIASDQIWQAKAEEIQDSERKKPGREEKGEEPVRNFIRPEEIQWEKAEKCYDGKREASLTGYYGEKKVENKVTVCVQLKESNTGIYTEAILLKVIRQPEQMELGNWEQKEISDIQITVLPKNLYLQIEDYEAAYGTDLESLEKNLRKHGKVKIKEGALPEDLDKIILPEVILRKPYPAFHIGVYENCLIPEWKGENGELADPLQGVVQGNYCMKVAQEDDYGTLKVIPQKIEEKEGIIEVEEREGVFQKKEKQEIWVRGGKKGEEPVRVKLHIRQESPFAEKYDEVWVKMQEDGDTFINATKEGIVFEEQTEGVQKRTGEWYLKDSRDSSGNTVTEVVKGLTFFIDSKAPEVLFQDFSAEHSELDGNEHALTFQTYKNTFCRQTVSVEDQKQMTEPGSGVKNWSYAVWNVEQDQKLTKTRVEELTEKGILQWNPVGEKMQCDISVGKGANGKAEDGNYVILVRAEDYVKNQSVFVSGGIIVDTKKPKVKITGIDAEKYYTEDVPFTIMAEDYDRKEQKVTSGIREICIALFCDGKECFSETEQISGDFSAAGNVSEQTLNELQEKAGITRKKKIEASLYNSNDMSLSITVYDGAGNPSTAEKRLKIDTQSPRITVSYDNNEVRNEKYFQEERTAEIFYQDQNFQKKNVTFDVRVGEKEKKNINVQQMEKEFGIPAEWKDVKANEKENVKGECLSLKFETEQEYEIKFHCKDQAGNAEEKILYGDAKAPEQFVIDKTDPIVEIQYYCDGKKIDLYGEEDKRVFQKEEIEAEIVIREKNFAFPEAFSSEENQIKYAVKAEGVQKGENAQEIGEGYQNQAAQRKSWKKTEKDTYKNTFLFEMDANYTAAFTYTDLSGRKIRTPLCVFTVDQTAPDGDILVDGEKNASEVWQEISFSLFQRDPYQVQLMGRDTTAGVASVKYYCSKVPLSKGEVKKIPEKQWKEAESFVAEPDQQLVVYGKIEDRAGNRRFLYPVRGMIADKSKPRVTLSLEGKKENDIYRQDVTVNVEVEDPQAGSTYAGIREITYCVTAEKNVQERIEGSLFQESDDSKPGKAVWKGHVVIPAERFNSNDVKIQVCAKDKAGNEQTESKEPIQIDQTAPVIQVNYDSQIPANGKYYRKPRTATVSIQERNFDEQNVIFQAESTDGKQPVAGKWVRQKTDQNTDRTTYTCSVVFQEDGEYTFSLRCKDKAGNQEVYESKEAFVVDQTAPVIRVAYEEQKTRQPGYYREPRKAEVTVCERNFRPDDVMIRMTASLDGKEQKVPEIGMFAEKIADPGSIFQDQKNVTADLHSTTIVYGEDGDYTFDIAYTDLAGNVAEDYQEDHFTIDRTSPTVEILGVEDQSANRGTVAPQIRYQDRNYEEEDVRIELNGYHRGKVPAEGQKTEIVNGQHIQLPDFAWVQEQDDLYTLTVHMTDKAGNETKKEIAFSVNRFGSVYTFSESTRNLVQKYYTDQPGEIEVTEINIDTLQTREVSYGRNGELVRLEHGKDYTVQKSEPAHGWKKYTYKIYRHNFQKEGNYTVTLSSKDRAENRMNNKIKDRAIDFVVDRTAPAVVVTGIEDHGKYQMTSKKLTVHVEDNFAAERIQVSVSTEKGTQRQYNVGLQKGQHGEAEVSVDQSEGWQTVCVSGIDAAGNQSGEQVFHVLVTPDQWIQFLYQLPVAAGVMLTVFSLSFGAGIVWKKRSRKQRK